MTTDLGGGKKNVHFQVEECSPSPMMHSHQCQMHFASNRKREWGWLLLGDETLLPLSRNSIKHSGRDGSDYGGGEKGREGEKRLWEQGKEEGGEEERK